MRIKSRTWLWIVAGVLLVALLGWLVLPGLLSSRSTDDQPATGDKVVAFMGDLATTTAATGEVAAGRQVRLVLATAGRVEQIHTAVGEAVAAGDPLVSLEIGALLQLARLILISRGNSSRRR